MKKTKTILTRLLCFAFVIALTSCGGADTQTGSDASDTGISDATNDSEQTEANDDNTTEWVRPTYEELVETMMKEGKIIADFIRDNKFIYGHARINPAINWRELDPAKAIKPDERIVACDRMVNWIMFRAGFIDQNWFHGINLDRYAEEHGFMRIDNARSCKAGDIVFVNPDSKGNPTHVFICAGPNMRYDAGSDERINGSRGPQPFNEPILNFCYGWRPSPDYLPDPSMIDIYNTPSDDIAKPSENTEALHTEENATDTVTINYSYSHSNDKYSAYEFHVNLSTKNSTSKSNTWVASYIGSALPAKRDTPSRYDGGIWIAFRGDNSAYLFLGELSEAKVWNERVAKFTLPESTDSMHEYTVVDTGEYIKYFMKLSNGEQHLICTIRVDAEYDQIVVRNNEGKIVYAGECKIEDKCYFKVWNHGMDMKCEDISINGVKA